MSVALTEADIKENTRLYNSHWGSLNMPDGWFVQRHKWDRYPFLSQIEQLSGFPLKGSSCLDVGCGMGDLAGFLRRKGVRHYVGIDVYPPAIETARLRNPKEEFILGDFLDTDFGQNFDYVFLSGAITFRLKTDPQKLARATIARMWELSRVGFAFNYFTNDLPEGIFDEYRAVYSTADTLEFCEGLDPESFVRHTEGPGKSEVHMYVYRDGIELPTKPSIPPFQPSMLERLIASLFR